MLNKVNQRLILDDHNQWFKIIAPCIIYDISGVPKFSQNTTEEDLDNVINVSKMFKLHQLQTICENVKREEEFLNPSIGTYFNDQVGERLKNMFLNKSMFADIIFKVEGTWNIITPALNNLLISD